MATDLIEMLCVVPAFLRSQQYQEDNSWQLYIWPTFSMVPWGVYYLDCTGDEWGIRFQNLHEPFIFFFSKRVIFIIFTHCN